MKPVTGNCMKLHLGKPANGIPLEILLYASIAQLAEQLTFNQRVLGSSPSGGTNAGKHLVDSKQQAMMHFPCGEESRRFKSCPAGFYNLKVSVVFPVQFGGALKTLKLKCTRGEEKLENGQCWHMVCAPHIILI